MYVAYIKDNIRNGVTNMSEVESFRTTASVYPLFDAMGNPLVHMACDGACKPDGRGGCAWFDGTKYHKASCANKTTNNQQEYTGLINLMQQLVNEKFDGRALIMMDSQLVVYQMNGKYGVKTEGLKPYYAKAKQLESLLDVEIIWVPRSNPIMGKVDTLAKEASKQ